MHLDLLCCVLIFARWSFVDVPLIISCRADYVSDWQPRMHVYTPRMLSTFPFLADIFNMIVSVGKRDGDAKAALVWNYLEDYWPCAGGLSTVNVIGTQLRDPRNSGLTQRRCCCCCFSHSAHWLPTRKKLL